MDENASVGSATPQTSQIPQLLNTLLANPELMGNIKKMLTSEPAGEKSASPPDTQDTVPVSNSVGSDGLASLLSDPAVMAKLPGIIAAVKPLLADLPTAQEPAHPVSSQMNTASSKSLPVCRDNLLLALKPFLSPARCEAIDSMIRIAKLGELLGQLK